ncbi:MAG: 1-acyl-sn-glycerol-3-phosphate acyltransferase [Marinibacterium sp.]
MTLAPDTENPLDAAIRERLHLGGEARASLWAVRTLVSAADGLNRLIFGRPFFALRESEALLEQLDGITGPDLVHKLMTLNGGTTIRAHGLDHVPKNGPVIIASTHPTGMFDFLAHAEALLDRRPDFKVVANQEVERFLGADMLIPVVISKDNRARSGARTRTAMMTHLSQGGALLIFGSGRVPHRLHGFLVEPDWRSGASHVSKACGVPVVPASLDARNSDAYYRLRDMALTLSGGNDSFGARIASLRYLNDLVDKLGGTYDVHYGPGMSPGTEPGDLQSAAETLVPGLYATSSATGKGHRFSQ